VSDTDAEQEWEVKRTRAAFRALVDEMLVQLREASNNELWTPEARARAESDLARIMDSVKKEALSDRGKGD
jgi:hypothetical protein